MLQYKCWDYKRPLWMREQANSLLIRTFFNEIWYSSYTKLHKNEPNYDIEWKQSVILWDIWHVHIKHLSKLHVCHMKSVKTFLSPQVLSSTSTWAPVFRGRGWWCTPTTHSKDKCFSETTSAFWHGTTQQEGRMTLISFALWNSKYPGPISTTLLMGKIL